MIDLRRSVLSDFVLDAILDTLPSRVFWKDAGLVYLGCNSNFARDAGFETAREVIGKDDFVMPWRDQADLYRQDDMEVMESGRAKLLIEEPQTTPSGSRITLLTSKVPLRDRDGAIVGVLGTYLDITERKAIEEEKDRLVVALQEALSEVRTLKEIIPMCGYCKRIRDDEGGWEQVDVYIRQHSHSDFSHGVCPDCERKHFPDP